MEVALQVVEAVVVVAAESRVRCDGATLATLASPVYWIP
ncbi:hypothetical protein FB472_0510 [Rhodoglobus vestalii]|uniref:Uncharacterized protein n=1 Tax=Rhodoglobus vestalii TaxID=193384 RepID=A0A8H2K576_9MICO|nr:hypothetical protein FB472_0510 [Rhodoglobus vestalii]